jgi:hypothetical protein
MRVRQYQDINPRKIANIMVIPQNIKTQLAWTFKETLPGTFKRNKVDFAHHDYPIIAPLPTQKKDTRPVEDCGKPGPFIYFVVDRAGTITYIGKSQEKHVLVRWMRPGIGGPSDYYWTHSTKKGGSVFRIAEGIRSGLGPYCLRYATLADLAREYSHQFGITTDMPENKTLAVIEDGLKSLLKPLWNIQ